MGRPSDGSDVASSITGYGVIFDHLGALVTRLPQCYAISKEDGIYNGISRIIWIIGRPTSQELRLSWV